MHYLDRSSVAAPSCLANYNHPHQAWDNLGSACKEQLRSALTALQKPDTVHNSVRCAYCESAIRHDGHIEHFRRKHSAHFPHLVFEWSNLFLSCGSTRHCGHYKDRHSAQPYNPSQLIKPDEDDPEQYLYFHSTGEVRTRENLSSAARLRALKTIEVFCLSDPSLTGGRAKAVAAYRKRILGELEEIESWDPNDREEYFRAEIEETRWEPYATTIKHFLMKRN